MGKPTITYSEYKELAKKHNESDSVSERKGIEKKVGLEAGGLLDRVDFLCYKLGIRLSPCGEFNMKLEEDGTLDERYVHLAFDDYRQAINDEDCPVVKERFVNVDMTLLDESELDAYADEVINGQVKEIENAIEAEKDKITCANKMLNELRDKLEDKKEMLGKGWRDISGIEPLKGEDGTGK